MVRHRGAVGQDAEERPEQAALPNEQALDRNRRTVGVHSLGHGNRLRDPHRRSGEQVFHVAGIQEFRDQILDRFGGVGRIHPKFPSIHQEAEGRPVDTAYSNAWRLAAEVSSPCGAAAMPD